MTAFTKAVLEAWRYNNFAEEAIVQIGISQSHTAAEVKKTAAQIKNSLPKNWELVEARFVPARANFAIAAFGWFSFRRKWFT